MIKKEYLKHLHNELCEQLCKYNHFYQIGSPLVSDDEYDAKYRELEEIESQAKQHLDLRNSPTQKLWSKKGDIPHITPMLSIKNCWDEKQLANFLKRVGSVEIVGEPKYDGVALSLTYYEGSLIQALTRGDGYWGESVLDHIRLVPTVPRSIKYQGALCVRGEIIMYDHNFAKFNTSCSKRFSNARNLVAGAIRRLDIQDESCFRFMNFYAYGLESSPHTKHSEDISFLAELGFDVPSPTIITTSTCSILKFYQDFLQQDKVFAADGIVLKVNCHEMSKSLGSSLKYSRSQVAYKFPSQAQISEITEIHLSIGRTGVITPVAKFNAVLLGGAWIEKATLFNFSFLQENNVKVGNKVVVQRSGGVIPFIREVLDPHPHIRMSLPQHCPECQQSLTTIDKLTKCLNEQCPGIITQKISWQAGKSMFNIRGCNIATISVLYREGMIDSFFDLYHLKLESLLGLPSFGEKRAHNLLANINQRRCVSLVTAIQFLEIPGLGKAGSIALSKHIKCLRGLRTLSQEQLQSIPGFGWSTCENIRMFLQTGDAIKKIDSILANVKVI